MIVSQPRELLWAWLNSRLGTPLSEDFRAVGLVRNGCIQAVAGYNAWVGKTCCFHGAIDDRSAIDRTYLRAIFEYPFDQCGMKALLAVVSELNEKSLSFCERSGFQRIDNLAAAGLEGEDMILLKLERLNCTWLRYRHGKEKRASGSGLHGSGREDGREQSAEHKPADYGQPPEYLHTLGQPDLVV